MNEFLVTIPELKIRETLIEAYKPNTAAARAVDSHDHEHLSTRKGVGLIVIVKDEEGYVSVYKVRGKVRNEVEEFK